MTRNRRTPAARIEELEAEVRRRRSTSQVQADFSIGEGREKELDERKPGELSTSERQARALSKPCGRGGRRWEEVES